MERIIWSRNLVVAAFNIMVMFSIQSNVSEVTCSAFPGYIYEQIPTRTSMENYPPSVTHICRHSLPNHWCPVCMGSWIDLQSAPHRYQHDDIYNSKIELRPPWTFRPDMLISITPVAWATTPYYDLGMDLRESITKTRKDELYKDRSLHFKDNSNMHTTAEITSQNLIPFHHEKIPSMLKNIYPKEFDKRQGYNIYSKDWPTDPNIFQAEFGKDIDSECGWTILQENELSGPKGPSEIIEKIHTSTSHGKDWREIVRNTEQSPYSWGGKLYATKNKIQKAMIDVDSSEYSDQINFDDNPIITEYSKDYETNNYDDRSHKKYGVGSGSRCANGCRGSSCKCNCGCGEEKCRFCGYFGGDTRGDNPGISEACDKSSIKETNDEVPTSSSITPPCNHHHYDSFNDENANTDSQAINPEWYSILDKINSPCSLGRGCCCRSAVKPSDSLSLSGLGDYAKEYRADMEDMYTISGCCSCKCGGKGGCGCSTGIKCEPNKNQIILSDNRSSNILNKKCNSEDNECAQCTTYSDWMKYIKGVSEKVSDVCHQKCDSDENNSENSSSDKDEWKSLVCTQIIQTLSKSLSFMKEEDLKICNRICVHTPCIIFSKGSENYPKLKSGTATRPVRDTDHVDKYPQSNPRDRKLHHQSDKSEETPFKQFSTCEGHDNELTNDPSQVTLVNNIRKAIGLLKEPKFRTFLSEPLAFQILYVLSKALDDALTGEVEAAFQSEMGSFTGDDTDFVTDTLDSDIDFPSQGNKIKQDCSVKKIKCETICSIQDTISSFSDDDKITKNKNCFRECHNAKDHEDITLPVSVVQKPASSSPSVPLSQESPHTSCSSSTNVQNGYAFSPDIDFAKSGCDATWHEKNQRIQSQHLRSSDPPERIPALPVPVLLNVPPLSASKSKAEINPRPCATRGLDTNKHTGMLESLSSKLREAEDETKRAYQPEISGHNREIYLDQCSCLLESNEAKKSSVESRSRTRDEKDILQVLSKYNRKEYDMSSKESLEVGDSYWQSDDFQPNMGFSRSNSNAFDKNDGADSGNLFVESPGKSSDRSWYTPGFSTEQSSSIADGHNFSREIPRTRSVNQSKGGTQSQQKGFNSNTEEEQTTTHTATAAWWPKVGPNRSSPLIYELPIWWAPN